MELLKHSCTHMYKISQVLGFSSRAWVEMQNSSAKLPWAQENCAVQLSSTRVKEGWKYPFAPEKFLQMSHVVAGGTNSREQA